MSQVKTYASMVKFSHTIFALPFALTAYVYALTSTNTPFNLLLLFKILVCMVTARNTAMGFNRWADRDIDALNPRTASREIPAGKISPRAALIFVIINALIFALCALWINPLCGALSPVALLVVMGYSRTKRFTSLAHVVLGLSLGIAPVGAFLAVTGYFAFAPMILSAAVITWTAGFDILYALQDRDFDRAHGLHSIPSRFSPIASAIISIALHCVTLYALVAFGMAIEATMFYWIGYGIFTLWIIAQHVLYTPKKIDRIGKSFGLMNGAASISFAVCCIVDLLTH